MKKILILNIFFCFLVLKASFAQQPIQCQIHKLIKQNKEITALILKGPNSKLIKIDCNKIPIYKIEFEQDLIKKKKIKCDEIGKEINCSIILDKNKKIRELIIQ